MKFWNETCVTTSESDLYNNIVHAGMMAPDSYLMDIHECTSGPRGNVEKQVNEY